MSPATAMVSIACIAAVLATDNAGADSAQGGAVDATAADCSTRTDASCGRYGGFVDTRTGRATAPFSVPGLPTVRSEFTQAIAVVVGGHYVIGGGYSVGLRVPMAPSPVELPGGSYVDDKAFGNPELFGERALPTRRWRGARLSVRLRGAIGVPLAFTGPAGSVTRNRALAISNALDMWRDQGLYTPGVVPLAAAASAELRDARWMLGLAAKLPVLFRISDAELPDDAETRAVAITPVVSATARASVRPWFRLGISAALALSRAPTESPAGGAAQASVQPYFEFAIGSKVTVIADALIPVGGPLQDTLGFGVHLEVHR